MTAFCPAIIVPGIAPSEDKLLQGRLFSYADTQRYRLGANYLTLPVNQPKCPFMSMAHDGAMNMVHRTEEVNYFPSRHAEARHAAPHPISPAPTQGMRVKEMIHKENNFKQPGERFRSFDPARQERFLERFAGMMADPRCTQEVRDVWLGYWAQADPSLAQRLAQKLRAKTGALTQASL